MMVHNHHLRLAAVAAVLIGAAAAGLAQAQPSPTLSFATSFENAASEQTATGGFWIGAPSVVPPVTVSWASTAAARTGSKGIRINNNAAGAAVTLEASSYP